MGRGPPKVSSNGVEVFVHSKEINTWAKPQKKKRTRGRKRLGEGFEAGTENELTSTNPAREGEKRLFGKRRLKRHNKKRAGKDRN